MNSQRQREGCIYISAAILACFSIDTVPAKKKKKKKNSRHATNAAQTLDRYVAVGIVGGCKQRAKCAAVRTSTGGPGWKVSYPVHSLLASIVVPGEISKQWTQQLVSISCLLIYFFHPAAHHVT